MNPPHGLVICIIALFVMTCNCNSQATQYSKNKIKKDNLKKIIKKNHMGKNTVAMDNNFQKSYNVFLTYCNCNF